MLLFLLLPAVVFAAQDFEYTITSSWNGEPLPEDEYTFISLSSSELVPGALKVKVDAPLYNDSRIPEGEPGYICKEGLNHHQDVELFVSNNKNEYFQLQVSPFSLYRTFFLLSYRKEIAQDAKLRYAARVNGGRWVGVAHIPSGYLPTKACCFNVHAIHGTKPDKFYQSLFPTDSTGVPDFHNMDFFQPLQLSNLVPIHIKDSLTWKTAKIHFKV